MADWFDYWIDTYAHPNTHLYANEWKTGPRARRAIVGAIERGTKSRVHNVAIYEVERDDA